MDLLELNPALRSPSVEVIQPEQDALSLGQRFMNQGRAAVSAVVEKLAAPFEALDAMPTINRRLALAGTIGATIGSVVGYKAESASGHVPVDGAKSVPARISSATPRTTSTAPNTTGKTSSTGSAAKITYYEQGDKRMVREYYREVKKGHCIEKSAITSDPHGNDHNHSGKSEPSKYGRSFFSYTNAGESQSINVRPSKGFKPCLMQITTLGYEVYFVPMNRLKKTKTGYKFTDPTDVHDESRRAAGSVVTLFAHS